MTDKVLMHGSRFTVSGYTVSGKMGTPIARSQQPEASSQ